LDNPLISEKHSLIDLGADEFTVGRPHPMIDYSLRNKRIIQEASDRTVAVILLDIVLGYGAIQIL
jgi:FdrA protein